MANTELAVTDSNRRRRRSFSKAYKAQVVAECGQGASTASVALAHGLNANLVWKWVRSAQAAGALAASPAFIAIKPAALPPATTQRIQVRLSRGDIQVEVRWPVEEASVCAAWLRQMLR
ncbi:MAG: transposase [Nevskiaceae bacterium]|jgi:transposase|nr:transposase [Nevskiaceae bacterium]